MFLRVREKSEKMLPEWVLEITRSCVNDKRGRKVRVDDTVRICPVCKRAWQNVNPRLHACKVKWYPSGVMPTIGKKRVICQDCK